MRKCVVSFEVMDGRRTGALLLHLAVIFHQLRINPLSLHLHEIAADRPVRTSRLTLTEEPRLKQLLEALTETDGIRNVQLHPEGGDHAPAH